MNALSPSSLISKPRRWAHRAAAIAFSLLAAPHAWAQDPIPSLQFANPTLQNPAFAGLIEGNFGLNFSHRFRAGTDDLRSQVSIVEAHMPLNFGTWYTGGAGITVVNDSYGGLLRNSAALNLAWEAPLGRKVRYFHVRAGVSAGFIQSSVQDPVFVFEDMYNATLGEFSGRTNESIAGLSSPVRLDVSAGLLIYRTQKIKGNREVNYFLGGAMYHLNQPNMGLLPSDNVQRSIRSVFMGGIKYRTRSSIDLNFHLNAVQQNNSLLATYTTFARFVLFERGVIHGSESAAFSLGTSVRQQLNEVTVNGESVRQTALESLVPFVGFDYARGFSFGLSYDAILSSQNALNNATGGLQFMVRYIVGGNKYKGQSLPFPSL